MSYLGRAFPDSCAIRVQMGWKLWTIWTLWTVFLPLYGLYGCCGRLDTLWTIPRLTVDQEVAGLPLWGTGNPRQPSLLAGFFPKSPAFSIF